MSNVRKNRIAVISQNPDLTAFFEMEAVSCGCPVQVLRTPPETTDDFDLIVLDADVGYCLAEDSRCKVITVISDSNQSHKAVSSLTWQFPISIETVRHAYEDMNDSSDKKNLNKEKTENEATLYLLSNPPFSILYRNQTIVLTESEWKILNRLGEENGKLVSRRELHALLNHEGGNLVDVHICHLRKKFEEPFGRKLIRTIRNQGYSLEAEIKSLTIS